MKNCHYHTRRLAQKPLLVISFSIKKMKRIYLSRHAKSSWNDLSLSDHDRPLNKRGLRDAPMMAEKVSSLIPAVDILVSSSAKRALETSEYFAKALKFKKITTESKLYHAGPSEILEVIGDLPSEYDSAFLFGHNPGFTFLYNHFARVPIDNLPTCGLFGLESTADDWYDVDTTNTRVELYIYPKMLLGQV